MDKYDRFWIDTLVDKVKERDELVRLIFYNEKEIKVLQEGIKQMQEKIKEIDSNIVTLHKPEVKNNKDKQDIHNKS